MLWEIYTKPGPGALAENLVRLYGYYGGGPNTLRTIMAGMVSAEACL